MQFRTVVGPLSLPLEEALMFRSKDSTMELETNDLEIELKDQGVEIFDRFDNVLITCQGYKILVPEELFVKLGLNVTCAVS